jgi:predicted transcriptional regulator
MKKDARLTFRVRSDLKKNIEEIANREGHSVAQICEAFLLAGRDAYKKQGSKFAKRALARLITKSSTD